MSNIIDGLPEGINLEGFRVANANPWSRDETVLGPDGHSFAAAFDIAEVTMMNDMGGVVWGEFRNSMPQITGHLPARSIACWGRPFCKWVTSHVFVVKLTDKRRHYPLLAIHTQRGFQIVGAGGLDTRPSDISTRDVPEAGWSSILPLK